MMIRCDNSVSNGIPIFATFSKPLFRGFIFVPWMLPIAEKKNLSDPETSPFTIHHHQKHMVNKEKHQLRSRLDLSYYTLREHNACQIKMARTSTLRSTLFLILSMSEFTVALRLDKSCRWWFFGSDT